MSLFSSIFFFYQECFDYGFYKKLNQAELMSRLVDIGVRLEEMLLKDSRSRVIYEAEG